SDHFNPRVHRQSSGNRLENHGVVIDQQHSYPAVHRRPIPLAKKPVFFGKSSCLIRRAEVFTAIGKSQDTQRILAWANESTSERFNDTPERHPTVRKDIKSTLLCNTVWHKYL